jgi:hypothetical protein
MSFEQITYNEPLMLKSVGTVDLSPTLHNGNGFVNKINFG